ncbi:MAG: hypothetical protein PHU42_01285 [Patescibacteria group bacterium]|nr:hypothetical protein [Patescibacteria group bacterium]
MITRGKKYISMIIGTVLIVSILVVGSYFATVRSKNANKNLAQKTEITDVTGGNINPQIEVRQVFTGTMKKLDQKLGLFNLTKEDAQMGVSEETINYYEAGKFTVGKYAGYTRIIAVRPDADYKSAPVPYVFATKDFKDYVFDWNKNKWGNDDDRVARLNSNKVTKKDFLDREAIDEIPINDQFVLDKETNMAFFVGNIAITSDPAATRNPNGGLSQSTILQTNFDEKNRLKSDYENLKFYADDTVYISYSLPGETPKNETPEQTTARETRDKYLTTRDGVIVVDSTGIGYHYFLNTKNSSLGFPASSKLADYIGLKFSKNQTDISIPIFDTYTSYNNGCIQLGDTTYLPNITDSETAKIGEIKSSQIAIYDLRNTNDPIFKYIYGNRFNQWFDEQVSKEENLTKPTLQEYVSKNPLLFIKDPWGRYLLLLEADYFYAVPCA